MLFIINTFLLRKTQKLLNIIISNKNLNDIGALFIKIKFAIYIFHKLFSFLLLVKHKTKEKDFLSLRQ